MNFGERGGCRTTRPTTSYFSEIPFVLLEITRYKRAMASHLLALDQGTTSSRAIVFSLDGSVVSLAQKEFTQYYPEPGLVEHDAAEIWSTQLSVARQALTEANLKSGDIAAIGITNQRETTVLWDRKTGIPLGPAIVWQDRRTASLCDQLRSEGRADEIQERTGLVIDAYFSGTKLKWLLDNVAGARKRAAAGELAFGTVDSWLIWNLTRGQCHVTDVSNASRTLLFNIAEERWDEALLTLLDIPPPVLPEVTASSGLLGHTDLDIFDEAIPISGIAGDQQAALFGQACSQPGMVKNTYGTGCFLLMNTGRNVIRSRNNLISTIAWKTDGNPVQYALEGSVFIAGSVVKWLRDGLGIIRQAADVEKLAGSVGSSEGVILVPAFTGLGAPHWDPYARGTIVGLTQNSTSAHIARAGLESIAFQVADVAQAMRDDASIEIREIRVDGGASANDLLMQFQADLLGVPIVRAKNQESTAWGAAMLAGLAVGCWRSVDDLAMLWSSDRSFEPGLGEDQRTAFMRQWRRAIDRARSWAQ